MIRKGFNGPNLKFFKFFDQKKIGSIPRILISSLVVVFFFYTIPIFINYKKNNNFAFQNNSKAILAYTLNNKKSGIETDNQILNEDDLLVDIFSLNDLKLTQLDLMHQLLTTFEDTNYTLDDVREKKLVKPVALTLLPQEIKMIENTQKKRVFYSNSFTFNFKRK